MDLGGEFDEYTDGLRPDQGIPVGTPQRLPITTTLLSAEELDAASGIALSDDAVNEKIGGHRYQIVEGEKCTDKEGKCSRVGIFDYDAGVCWHVFVGQASRTVEQVIQAGCSPSDPEIEEARAIAEADPRVKEILDSYDNETFIEWGRGIVARPPAAQGGHRYIGVRWNLDGGTAVAEFVVDLTTRSVCYEC
jgi:hypothetical protein